LSRDEAWEQLSSAHTGILTTLRRDGSPVTLPLWYVVLDRAIYFAAPSTTTKVKRIGHDGRASFLIERGRYWSELTAVHLSGTCTFVEDEAMIQRIDDALEEKYKSFRTPAEDLPQTARTLYAARTFVKFAPQERMLSWDNTRIGARAGE
jgi:nitroimidazol reductase NimA-like FMN-containing flavoprotein (pyridoxamine 5'-phosphate oxidase superfamily)